MESSDLLKSKNKTRPAVLLSLLLALIMCFVIAIPSGQAEAAERKNVPAQVNELLKLVNKFRTDKGLSKVKINTDISKVSVDWSAKMADTRNFEHNPNYHSDPRVDKSWSGAGEIIAMNSFGSVEMLHEQWVDSPPHNDIMSGKNYNVVGIGLAYTDKGAIYGTMNFFNYGKIPANTYDSFPSSSTNPPKYTTKGAIGTYYGKNKAKTGTPTSNEKALTNPKGAYQNFKNGVVYWSSKTGAHFNSGGIRTAYKGMKYEKGKLGFPTSDEKKFKYRSSAVYQNFEHGMIIWSSKTKGQPMNGAILTKWKALGWERSSLGLPKSKEYSKSGKIRQDFEKGYATWTSKEGVKVYKK